jgi:hypothetical protein
MPPPDPSTRAEYAAVPVEPMPEAAGKALGLGFFAVLVAIVLVVAGGGYLVYDKLNGPKTATIKAIVYPKTWDSRILPFVTIAEKERGLAFKHPVAVKFLSAKAFEKTVSTEAKSLNKSQKKEIEQTDALFRAFGLIDGSTNLFEATNSAQGSGILAYYSFEDKAITIRGSELTLAMHATLVHELTHVLQDQWYDIGNRLDALQKKESQGAASTAYEALDAIVEGDAERTADLYRSSLNAKQLRVLTKAENADQKGAQKALTKLPSIVVATMGAPYALGQALTEAVAVGGNEAVNKLLENPPTSDAVLLNPLSAIGTAPTATNVAVPKTLAGEKKFNSGQIGSVVTYLMLAQRLPLTVALAAADGWNGDGELSFYRGSTACGRVAFATTDQAAQRRLLAALHSWSAKGKGSPAKVSTAGSLIVMESCDPGKATKLTKDVGNDALQLVATRSFLAVTIMKQGVPAAAAQCVSQALVQDYTEAQLVDPNLGAHDPSIAAHIRTLALACVRQTSTA